MEIAKISLKSYYTCQICSKNFEGMETEIIRNFHPTCSKKCEIYAIYNIIKKMDYDEETLYFIQNRWGFKQQKRDFNKDIAILNISNKILSLNLNMIKVWTLDKDIIDWTCPDKEWTLDINSLSYEIRENVHVHVPSFSEMDKKGMSTDLRKWF